jgi:hypothetical protein
LFLLKTVALAAVLESLKLSVPPKLVVETRTPSLTMVAVPALCC